MRKSNTQKINEVLDDSLKSLNIDHKLDEVRLINSWEEVVGKTITKYTNGLFIKKKKLFVNLDSSVVRNELYMIKDELIDALNKKAGKKIIEEIVFK